MVSKTLQHLLKALVRLDNLYKRQASNTTVSHSPEDHFELTKQVSYKTEKLKIIHDIFEHKRVAPWYTTDESEFYLWVETFPWWN